MQLDTRNPIVAKTLNRSKSPHAGWYGQLSQLLLEPIVGIITTVLLLGLSLCVIAGCASFGDKQAPSKQEKEAGLIQAELSLAKEYLDRGEANLAWTSLRPLYQRAPSNPEVLNIVGLTHLALENHQSATQVLLKAYGLEPNAPCGLNLSSAYIAMGQYEKARALLLSLLKKHPDYGYSERLWHNLALTYEHEHRLGEAIRSYEKAVKTNPNFTLSLLRLAAIYMRSNQEQLAIKTYQKALRLCSTCYEAVGTIATHQLNRGHFSAAITLLQNYIKQKNALRNERKEAQNLLSLAENLKARQNKRSPQPSRQ